MRRSSALRMITDVAATPVTVRSLVEKLAAEFPDDEVAAIDATVAGLISCGVLISCLRPPSTVGDKLGYVLDRLQEVRVSELTDTAPVVTVLQDVLAWTHTASGPPGQRTATARSSAAERMQALAPPDGAAFAVDVKLGCAVSLPDSVAHEAEAAADALLRLTPQPAGHPAWREYHSRFLDRYASGAVVPLAQLVDSTIGLGFPRHFAPPLEPNREQRVMSERDEHLLVLAQRAALDGTREIDLDDDLLDTLATTPAAATERVRHAPHLDLCVDVRASTAAALREGAFTLPVTGIGRSGIATSGRFLDLLGDDDRQRMVTEYRALPVAVEGALAAQLSFPAQHPRVDNVAQVPLVLSALLSSGEYRDNKAAQVLVGDLAVTADHHRMYVMSVSRR